MEQMQKKRKDLKLLLLKETIFYWTLHRKGLIQKTITWTCIIQTELYCSAWNICDRRTRFIAHLHTFFLGGRDFLKVGRVTVPLLHLAPTSLPRRISPSVFVVAVAKFPPALSENKSEILRLAFESLFSPPSSSDAARAAANVPASLPLSEKTSRTLSLNLS